MDEEESEGGVKVEARREGRDLDRRFMSLEAVAGLLLECRRRAIVSGSIPLLPLLPPRAKPRCECRLRERLSVNGESTKERCCESGELDENGVDVEDEEGGE